MRVKNSVISQFHTRAARRIHSNSLIYIHEETHNYPFDSDLESDFPMAPIIGLPFLSSLPLNKTC